MIILLLLSLVIFILLGVPIFAAIGFSSAIYIIFNDLPIVIVIQQMFNGIDNFLLLAVPFFVFAGSLMNATKITDYLLDFTNNLVGHVHGGMGHVNILVSLIFSGMSGTALADAAGLGVIEMKAMKDAGYDIEFSVGVTAGSSILGPIMPPSVPMVVYAAMASVSVGKLFVAGIIPALIVSFCLFLLVFYFAKKNKYPRRARAPLKLLLTSLIKSIPALFAPIIILGGVIFGIFTPTEAAVVATIYALTISIFVYRSFKLKEFITVVVDAFETTSSVMIMVATSMLFGWVLTRENIALNFMEFLIQFAKEPWQVLVLLNVILLIVGMFMETVSIILIITPIIIPTLTYFGIDLTHFGIIMILTLMIGLITPPVGLVLFVMSKLAKLDMTSTFLACVPFLLPLVITLILINFFPSIVLFLPKIIFGG